MIDTDKYEGHTTDYYFEGSNFDFSHVTMYDSNGNILAVLKSNDKRLVAGIPFVSPTLELMCDAPLLLAEVKRLTDIIADYRRFHTWVSEKHYEVIEEWDFLEGVMEGYEVIEEWEGEEE